MNVSITALHHCQVQSSSSYSDCKTAILLFQNIGEIKIGWDTLAFGLFDGVNFWDGCKTLLDANEESGLKGIS
jgi:hypothetical protein